MADDTTTTGLDPDDTRSHIDRINPDAPPAVAPGTLLGEQPDGRRSYRLREAQNFAGTISPAGTVVMLLPDEAGDNHDLVTEDMLRPPESMPMSIHPPENVPVLVDDSLSRPALGDAVGTLTAPPSEPMPAPELSPEEYTGPERRSEPRASDADVWTDEHRAAANQEARPFGGSAPENETQGYQDAEKDRRENEDD